MNTTLIQLVEEVLVEMPQKFKPGSKEMHGLKCQKTSTFFEGQKNQKLEFAPTDLII